MNKKFSRIILSFALAFAMLIPMFATKVAAQSSSNNNVVFVVRINNQLSLLESLMLRTEGTFGLTRVFLIGGTLLGISATQLQLEAQSFDLSASNFIVARILSQQGGIPINRVVFLFNSGRTFGEIALALGIQLKPLTLRIGAFINVFTNEVGVTAGTTTDEQFATILTRLFDVVSLRLNTLQLRLGAGIFNSLLLTRLSTETNIPIEDLLALHNRFPNLSLPNFALRLLLASTLSATNIQELKDLGFVFEDVNIITPLGVYRTLSAFGVPVTVFIARVDVFQRLVRIDANNTLP